MTNTHQDNQEFIELAMRCLTGFAKEDEHRELESQLKSDSAKVRLYNDLCLHIQLLEDDEGLRPKPTDSDWAATRRANAVGDESPRNRVHGWTALTAAGALVVGVVMGIAATWSHTQFSEPDTAARPASVIHDNAFLAMLVDVEDDVTWSPDHDMPREPGAGLNKGWMRLESGAIDIAFRSGATVHLDGPAMFGIDSCLRATLEYGGIDVYAPDSAAGFTVNTSAMEVVDLGTRFAMTIDMDSGKADVAVSEGQVDLHVGNVGRNASIHSLMQGQSASVGTTGEVLAAPGRSVVNGTGSVGLLGWWSFNDVDNPVSAGDTVVDSSPLGLHGRVMETPDDSTEQIQSVAGMSGRALSLPRQGTVDLSEHVATLGSLSDFTIAAWVRNPENMIFSISNAMDRYRVQFERHLDCLVYGWQNDGQWDAVRTVVDGGWKEDQWYHVAVTMRDGSVTLFRDGQTLLGPRSTGVLLGTPVQRPVDLGRKNCVLIGKADRSESASPHAGWIPEQFLNGEIDDLQIYDRALDAAEIQHLHSHPGEINQKTLSNAR